MNTAPDPPATSTSAAPLAELELTTAEEDSCFHNYVGHQIPWYVRLLWILFWIFAVYYTLTYLFPALRIELTTPP